MQASVPSKTAVHSARVRAANSCPMISPKLRPTRLVVLGRQIRRVEFEALQELRVEVGFERTDGHRPAVARRRRSCRRERHHRGCSRRAGPPRDRSPASRRRGSSETAAPSRMAECTTVPPERSRSCSAASTPATRNIAPPPSPTRLRGGAIRSASPIACSAPAQADVVDVVTGHRRRTDRSGPHPVIRP